MKDINQLFSIVVFDLETTGLSSFQDDIIEIGAVRFVKGEITDRYSCFVKAEKEVPPFIYKLTNITPEQLAGGMKITDALKGFIDFLKPTDVLVAHNAPFDIGFMQAKLKKYGYDRLYHDVIDTCDMGRIFLPFLSNHKLETMASYFKLTNEGAHRAIYDAEVTGKVFYALSEFIYDCIPLETLNFILKVTEYALYSSGFKFFINEMRDYTLKHALVKEKKKGVIKFDNHNYINHHPNNYQTYELNDIFEANGLLNKNVNNYEVRQGQIQMSGAVEEVFKEEEYLLVEAGTGVGKSLAYLIPSIQFTHRNGKKVFISTNTKNLQEQLLQKDLPLIQSAIDTPFSAVLVKGRENYLCLRKWKDIYQEFINHTQVQQFSSFEASGLLYLAVWAQFTESGDISENHSFNSSDLSFIWKRLASDRHLCSGKKCSESGKCYLMDIRYKAEKASIVIVNHSLLFSDFMNENTSLGGMDYLVIDEAHNLLNSAAQHLGISISYPDVNGFIHSLFSYGKKYQNGLYVTLKTYAMKSSISEQSKEKVVKVVDDIINQIDDDNKCMEQLFKEIATISEKNGSFGKYRVKDVKSIPSFPLYGEKVVNFLSELLEKNEYLIGVLKGFSSDRFLDYDTQLSVIEGISERTFEFISDIKKVMNPNTDDYTLWFSTLNVKDEAYPAGVINYAPIEVSKILPDLIFSKVKSIVFTSATMAIRGSFKYFTSNLGLDSCPGIILKQEIVESPFNYPQQALVLNTSFLPNNNDAYFTPQSISLLKSIIEQNRVGSMLLFTSYKDLNLVFDSLGELCYQKNITLLAQGKTGSRSAMLSEFKKTGDAVLLGTSSFWEGVDVQGESLSLLILYKLPFQVPTDPIVEAFIEKLEKQGKNSFMHYSLPNALLKMRQGFGRLIRSKSDRGVILILDNRIKTKEYGKFFEEILPTRINYVQNPEQTLTNIYNWFKKI